MLVGAQHGNTGTTTHLHDLLEALHSRHVSALGSSGVPSSRALDRRPKLRPGRQPRGRCRRLRRRVPTPAALHPALHRLRLTGRRDAPDASGHGLCGWCCSCAALRLLWRSTPLGVLCRTHARRRHHTRSVVPYHLWGGPGVAVAPPPPHHPSAWMAQQQRPHAQAPRAEQRQQTRLLQAPAPLCAAWPPPTPSCAQSPRSGPPCEQPAPPCWTPPCCWAQRGLAQQRLRRCHQHQASACPCPTPSPLNSPTQ